MRFRASEILEGGHREIQEIPTSKLTVGPPFIREHDTTGLESSIKSTGVVVPIILSTGGRVLDGRLRLKACKNLGHSTIPAIVVEPQE